MERGVGQGVVGPFWQPRARRWEQVDPLSRLQRGLVHLWLQEALVIAIKHGLFLLLELMGVDHACSIGGFCVNSLALLGERVEVVVFVACFRRARPVALILESGPISLLAGGRWRSLIQSFNKNLDVGRTRRKVLAHHRESVTEEMCVCLFRLVIPVVEHALGKPDRLWLRGISPLKIAAPAWLSSRCFEYLWIDQELIKLQLPLGLAQGWLPRHARERGLHRVGLRARPGDGRSLRGTVHGQLLGNLLVLRNLARSALV